MVKNGDTIWYYSGWEFCTHGKVYGLKNNGDFYVSANDYCGIAQYDDSIMKYNVEDENVKFWKYDVANEVV